MVLKDHCDGCGKTLLEERRLETIRHLKNTINSTLRSFGLTERLLKIPYELPASIRPFIPSTEALKYFGSSNNDGLCLTGSSGVGKTFSMAMLIRDWTLNYIEKNALMPKDAWLFVNYPGFVMKVQDAYRKETGSSPLEILDEVASAPLLVIDDLGAEKATDFVKQATYYVLNEREGHMRPTFITTNFTLAQLNDWIDPRIGSRIGGMCKVMSVGGEDRRLKDRRQGAPKDKSDA